MDIFKRAYTFEDMRQVSMFARLAGAPPTVERLIYDLDGKGRLSEPSPPRGAVDLSEVERLRAALGEIKAVCYASDGPQRAWAIADEALRRAAVDPDAFDWSQWVREQVPTASTLGSARKTIERVMREAFAAAHSEREAVSGDQLRDALTHLVGVIDAFPAGGFRPPRLSPSLSEPELRSPPTKDP